MKKLAIFILLLVFSLCAWATVTDMYVFNNKEKQQRFQNLTQELRCLVCQNQSLADSQAPLANDLRGQIATMIRDGKTDPGILNFLTARYGEFILYRPPVNKSTYLLWFGPFVILLLLILGFITFVKLQMTKPAIKLSETEQHKLQDLFKRVGKN